jgi:hypothetical protein
MASGVDKENQVVNITSAADAARKKQEDLKKMIEDRYCISHHHHRDHGASLMPVQKEVACGEKEPISSCTRTISF